MESCFSKVQSTKLNTERNNINGWHRIFWRNRSSTTRSHTCQHHAEITQSHTFAALSKTIHNHSIIFSRLTYANYHRITRKNSAYCQINTSGIFSYTRLIKVPRCRVTRSADHLSLVFTPEKKSWPGSEFTWQFCSHLIHLTPKSLFPRPKT